MNVSNVHEKKKLFTCYICSAEFDDKFLMTKHVTFAHEDIEKGSIICHCCPKRFMTIDEMKNHASIVHNVNVGVHKRKKPYKCSFCHAKFNDQDEMNDHISIVHEKINMFKCSFCPAKFVTDEMKSHMVKCDFINQDDLNDHIYVVHEKKKMFVCSICPAEFDTTHKMKIHMRNVHKGNKPFLSYSVRYESENEKTHS